MEKNLGHATAYGYAKSKGYSGTEDEFAQLMADYASVGQSAAQSAEQAAASATSASGSAATASQAAQTATTKASDAIIAEGVATAKAEDAQAYATSANQSAESAGTSAQTATAKAGTATAKADEAAASEAAALSAKTDAESARDAAAQSASRAEQSAESIDPDEFNRKIYAAFATDTATGAIASFPDGADNIPMKNVVVHIEPVQAGSGDPSPDNVRPITGWTAAKVTRTGKNLWTFDDSYSTSGYTVLLNRVPFNLYPGTYTFSAVPNIEADSVVLFGYHEDGTRTEIGHLNASTTRSSSTATVSKPVVSLYFVANRSGTINNIQLELSSTATAYEPYSGQTYDITFPTEAGTVYGGTLDVTKGELVVDRVIWTGNTADMNNNEDYPGWVNVGIRDIVGSGANKGVSNAISNVSPTLTSGNYAIGVNTRSLNTGSLWLSKNYFNKNQTEWKALALDVQIVLPLATPITYQLTPQEITSLLGTNNLWADTGDSDVEYRADTKLYIDNKIAELQALVLENNGGN